MISPMEFLIMLVSLLPLIALIALVVYLMLSIRSLDRRLRSLEERSASDVGAPPHRLMHDH